MRKFVIITLAVPLIALVAYSMFTRLYTPDDIPEDFDYNEKEFEVTAADGASLATTAVQVKTQDTARPIIVQVAERSLDRDWNSRSVSFRTGERLAAILGGAGYHSLRFDHRGTGETRASRRTSTDLELMATDILSVARAGRRRFAPSIKIEGLGPEPITAGPAPVFYIAHDSGCALALKAVADELKSRANGKQAKAGATKPGPRPAGVVLLACDTSGTLLEQWGRQLLYNMQRKNVDPAIVERARAEWRQLLKDGRLPEKEIAATEQPPPDLVAFREALRFLHSDGMREFRETAAQLDLEASLRVLLQYDVPVLHLIGTMDSELPPEAMASTRDLADKLRTNKNYRLQILPAMNHFLKKQERDLQGPGLALERMNPFRIIQPNATRLIREFIEANLAE
ncbi:MAG: alpha/beta fold hydrolase [bacterium]|nr:alpha/beta fold hydrolase [bacterium]